MCVAIPGKVIEVYENECLIQFRKIIAKVDTFFIEELKIGDYILVHAGSAMEKISEKDALEMMELFKSIRDEI